LVATLSSDKLHAVNLLNINDIGKYIKPMLLTISDLVVDMFLDSLTFGGLAKVAISKHFTVSIAQTLIEAQCLIYPLNRHFWVGAVELNLR